LKTNQIGGIKITRYAKKRGENIGKEMGDQQKGGETEKKKWKEILQADGTRTTVPFFNEEIRMRTREGGAGERLANKKGGKRTGEMRAENIGKAAGRERKLDENHRERRRQRVHIRDIQKP